MIKTILVFADDRPAFEATLAFAIELAQRFVAHIDVLYIRPDPTAVLPTIDDALAPSETEHIDREAGNTSEGQMPAARAIYDRVAARTNVSASWHVAAGLESEIAAAAGRLRDLTVIGRPDDPDERSWRSIVHAVLFNSGRPAMLLPRHPQPFFGERVALAWNGSAQAARAVAAALHFLRLAKKVNVLTAGAIDINVSTARLVEYLARHEIQAVAIEFETGLASIGEALLERTKLSHSTSLVMGAYSHTRFREMVLGGATREILAGADLPVFMSH